ncbi:hypothetical protein BATDEDRAFT_24412 [Batrachochytrium dendrobatidis JAM81]|uniref:RING-type domain-containing protein n=2 Tax=Batrachochytrium dendrobatidis TaxID=109871 RepID=F4P1G8_BATDJ|nr:uncharacterized protein BATDEDRAFT_24412 [Batrachochytrium dendrobatidis JAM81]EGF80906.1 hypothetical protein BATDEDRAFT_24412 [Batrachochytrium dendrobatidis JAM81]|eukprot:XP_006678448.1 hypothetical protein BATDEDRAFT_24412 [Batrachochytrium dendrobatidis JAM81]
MNDSTDKLSPNKRRRLFLNASPTVCRTSSETDETAFSLGQDPIEPFDILSKDLLAKTEPETIQADHEHLKESNTGVVEPCLESELLMLSGESIPNITTSQPTNSSEITFTTRSNSPAISSSTFLTTSQDTAPLIILDSTDDITHSSAQDVIDLTDDTPPLVISAPSTPPNSRLQQRNITDLTLPCPMIDSARSTSRHTHYSSDDIEIIRVVHPSVPNRATNLFTTHHITDFVMPPGRNSEGISGYTFHQHPQPSRIFEYTTIPHQPQVRFGAQYMPSNYMDQPTLFTHTSTSRVQPISINRALSSRDRLPTVTIPPPEPAPPPASLKCAVCLTLAGPTTQLSSTICGHIFCEECLLQSLGHDKRCPTCRKSIGRKSSYHRIYL